MFTCRAFFVYLTLLCSAFIALPLFAATTSEVVAYPYPKVSYGHNNAQAHQIKHGEYLVKAGDCIACHTVPGGASFAGGLPVKTPFGTIYAPNITPDKQTGIGRWSQDAFVKAMREGINNHGDYLYPVFPYVYYNKLSRQDVLAIYAYLSRIPPVHKANLPLDMQWPFNVRLFQSFWRFLFFDFYKGEYQPNKRKSHQWNRGAYLVQGPGHCAMCHSPLNALGAVQRQYNLTGGFIEGYHAPNISKSGLKGITIDQIVSVFLHDKRPGGGHIQGPMLDVNHNSLRYLNVSDLRAIAVYLKTVESRTPPMPKLASGKAAGKAIYDKYCAGCHNMGGGGAPKFKDAAMWHPLLMQGMDTLYHNAIHGIGGMPAKGNCDSCTDAQIKQAVDYIVKPVSGAKSFAPSATAKPSVTSVIKGKKVYDRVCSVCHTKGQLGAPRLGDKQAWQPLLKQNMDVLVGHAIDGYKGHPPMGACYPCTDADVIAAVKYMAQQSGGGDYSLW